MEKFPSQEPVFLSVLDVMEIHHDQIELYGGASGIRDRNLLDSAVAVPQSGFGDAYAHSDLFEMAAAYLYHLVRNHPFVDGNKRTGTASALVFLDINGWSVECSEDELVDLVLGVAEGRVDKVAAADFLRQGRTPVIDP